MIKEFEINDILNAIDKISKTNRNKTDETEMKNDFTNKNDILTLNNQAKPSKSDVLVLDQIIE
tara:strand:- start:225 stop:413 length:189 start_codon:yes stop_codon:yes gene_type:complete